MKTLISIFLLAGSVYSFQGVCQKKPARSMGSPIMTDTLSTLFIPVKYNEELLSSNKIAFWREYYANIIVYNYKTDVYKKIFEQDVFIEGIRSDNYYNLRGNVKINNLTRNWVFLFVKLNNTNKDKRVDENDPSVLFAVSTDGESLKQLTDEKENVTGLENFEQQGFVLIRIQKDSDGDQSFTASDKEFYYKKINLSDLSSGNNIEIK